MAVSILTNRVIGNGNGVARTFSFSDVVISKSSDLVVVKRDVAGVETPLSEGASATTYSVSVTSFPGTGSIDYPASGGTLLVTGESIAMRSVRDLTQATDLENQGGYFADTQETAFDKLTYINQQQQDDIDRSIKFAVTSTFSGIAFPDPGTSGEAITWKADNTLQNSAISGATAVSVDETDTDVTKNKMVSNALAKGWEDYKDVGHLPLAGGTLTGLMTGTTLTLTGLATLTTALLTGTLTLDKGADLTPAAAAITLGTDGNYFDVVAGNFATINGVAGTFFTLQFDGVSVVTHHATNLDLPGEANFTSAAGDIMQGFLTGAATAQILAITKADGTAIVVTTPTFSESFTSSDQTITLAGSLTLAHSLSTTPKLILVYLKNSTAQANYIAGDLLLHNAGGAITTYSGALSVVPDSTNLNIRIPSQAFVIPDKTTGGVVAATSASWKIVFHAWA